MRKRHELRVFHAGEQRLLLDILNGDHDRGAETREQTEIITRWISTLEGDIESRKRVRRLHDERDNRRRQRRMPFVKREPRSL